MKEVLYTKYNSKRIPRYQLSTSIVQDGEQKYALKKAIQPRANDHLQNLISNREKLKKLYRDIQLVECQSMEDGIAFPFIKGRHFMEDVNFVDGSLEEIIVNLKEGLTRITSYQEDMLCKFEMTEGFAEVFEGCEPKEGEEAIRIANVDSLFENFVVLEDENLCCIDYEWVFDFPIPKDYITFRNIYYFYHNNKDYLEEKIEKEAFYQRFGYKEEQVDLYIQMEEAFQQHVHGKNWEYMYLERYKKKTTIWAEIESDREIAKLHPRMMEEIECLSKTVCDNITEIESLREEVKHWASVAEEQNAYAAKLRRAIKNPFYGLKLAVGKLIRKIKHN